LRSLDAVSARPLPGTEGASFPFWSPDGRSVGFFGDGKLKRIDVDGGQPQNLTDAPAGRGASWNRDGTIIFTPAFASSPIFRIPAAGGEPSPVTRPESPKQTSHRFPQFLPDGRHFLYYVQGIPESRGIYIGDLQGSETRRLLDADSAAVYATPGRLLFVRQGTLFAQDFDAARLELRGNASPVAERIALDTAAEGSAAVSASRAGPFVYRTGSGSGLRQFVWLDRSGKDIGKAGGLLSTLSVELSPDGRRVALHQRANQNIDVWLLELGRGVLSRFTFDPAQDVFPIWSPDGSRIVFGSNRKDSSDLYQKPAIGAGTEELLLATAQEKFPTDCSPDGRFLLYRSVDPKTGDDLWALPLDGDRKPFPVVQTNFDERDAQFSPDGKWIAYQSNESGRFEIYIQPFPGPGSKLQVSTNGGAQVRWGPNGKELFYIALDARLMAVPIRLASNPQTAEPGSPTPLFATRVGGALQGTFRQQYDVSSDGQRFLMNTITEEAASPITVILNWNPEAKK
jgi:Tol biopolymer transport system component